MLSRVVPGGQLVDDARRLATEIAGYTSIGLVLTKEAFWHNVANPSLAGAIALENRNQRLAGQSAEVREYMAGYSRRHREER
jgi:enoyl-CoA hydratase/carnithine racemase